MNWKKTISALVLTSMLFPQVALAQSVPSPDPDPPEKGVKGSLPLPQLLPGEKDPGLAISPMKKGQRAPFTGVLLSPSAVADVIVEFETFEERIHIEVMKAVKEQQADCDKKLSDTETKLNTDKKILEANIGSKDRTIKNLQDQVKILTEEQNSRWPVGAWVGIGAAGGVALTILTAFAISKATQ